MAKGTTKDPDAAAELDAGNVASKFLGRVPKGYAQQDGNSASGDSGQAGTGAVADDAGTIDPISISTAATDRKKRKYTKRKTSNAGTNEPGRKEKAGLAVEPPEVPTNLVEQMALGIFSVHQMLAMGMQSPEIELTQQEADALAKALANVGRYYVAIKLGGASGAWLALVTTAGIIYVPRVMSIRNRRMGGIGHNGGPAMDGSVSRETPMASDLSLFQPGDEIVQ